MLRHMAAAELRLVAPAPIPSSHVPVARSGAVPIEPRASATGFAEAVRVVSGVSRRGRLVVPVFRSPPRHPEVDRTIRRRQSAPAVVSVRLGDRPLAAVRADVIDGVVAANGLSGERADRFRRDAWAALEGQAAAPHRPGTAA
jgi:hypothetical protein